MAIPCLRFVVRQTFLEFDTIAEQQDGHHALKRGRFISEDLQLPAQRVSLDDGEKCLACHGTGKGELFGRGCSTCNGTGRKQDQVEQIGSYRIVKDGRTLVTANACLQDYTEVAVLSKDAIVNVVEVVMMPRDKRIRARIESPAGWISLTSTESGFRWAVKEVDQSTDDAAATSHFSCQSSMSENCSSSPERNSIVATHGELSQIDFRLDDELALSSRPQKVKDHERTTIQLQRLPCNYNRDLLMETLNDEGFAGLYNFVYLPMDFKTLTSIGDALVNFSTYDSAQQALRCFDGFCKWKIPSSNCQGLEACSANWSAYCQGLQALIERYQNNPVMHQRVPEICRPLILNAGVALPFPEPTKRLRRPRNRRTTIEHVVQDDASS